MTDKEIEKKVIELVAGVLNIDEISLMDSQENINEWDSMAYLSILACLEDEFCLEITQENINNFVSIQSIITEIKNANP